jgi:hypothetical protein
MLYQTHGGGDDGAWHFHQWLWGLPPPGPLAFACEWPAHQIPRSEVEIDAGLVLEGRACYGPAAGGLSIGRISPCNQSGSASALNRTQQELGGNRLYPVAAQLSVAFDRVVHVPRQPLASTCQRGQDPTEPGTANAELGLDVSLELLVGHLGRMTAQDPRTSTAAGVSWATNRSARLAVIPPELAHAPEVQPWRCR